MREIDKLVRPHLKALKPYSSARDEFQGEAKAWLDANENAYGAVVPGLESIHRYPDPLQWDAKQQLASYKGLKADQVFLANGSDEIIELLVRTFCRPGEDAIISLPPTFPMYGVAADIHAVEHRAINLTDSWQPDVEQIKAQMAGAKILFLCSPNNPTGNLMDKATVAELLETFPGLVVIDEAYVDFSPKASSLKLLKKHPRLVILQTFSKAWGLAAARLGVAYAHPALLDWLNKVKAPYNLNTLSQEVLTKALGLASVMESRVSQIVDLRDQLSEQLRQLDLFKHVFPSDANFILVSGGKCRAIYEHLLSQGVVVRLRGKLPHVGDALRITVGTEAENELLLEALHTFEG